MLIILVVDYGARAHRKRAAIVHVAVVRIQAHRVMMCGRGLRED